MGDNRSLLSNTTVRSSPSNSRVSRDKKALSLGTSLLHHSDAVTGSGLLSEISKSLNTSHLLSHESMAILPSTKLTAGSKTSIHLPTSDQHNVEHDGVVHDDVFVQSGRRSNLSNKSVSFLWRVLGRARPNCHANIHVVSIMAVAAVSSEDISLRKGQHLRALFRVSNRIFVETPSHKQGFVPYRSCRLSRKHYGPLSKLLQLSYAQLYPQSPDGIDIQPTEHIPSIKMVARSDYFSSSHEELHARSKQAFIVLYCDSTWVYVVSGKLGGLLPRSVCELAQESQVVFKQWMLPTSPFQSDFVMKHGRERPQILNKSAVSVASSSQKASSKVGKIFTIVHNFVPTSPNSSNFTIRKGLRVKVIEESEQDICVITRTGFSFWIPHTHVRPARKGSVLT